MKLTRRLLRIQDFIKEINEDEDFRLGIQARLSSSHELVKTNKVTQIRSKKHDADVIAFDVLGNMTVLYGDGSIRQYITEEEKKVSGVLR